MNIWVEKNQLSFGVGDWIYWDENAVSKNLWNLCVDYHPKPRQIKGIHLVPDSWRVHVETGHWYADLGDSQQLNLKNQKKVSKDFVPHKN